MMEFFVKIINGLQLLTAFAKILHHGYLIVFLIFFCSYILTKLSLMIYADISISVHMLHFGYMFGYMFEICDCERSGKLDNVHINVKNLSQ